MSRKAWGAASPRARIAMALAPALAFAALGLNAWHYYPFVADDTFISLRYAARLLAGQGLTWTDGPPVEGYSNLLWTLLCAALGAVGVDLVRSSRILGLLSMGAALLAIWRALRPRRPIEACAALAGMLGLALAGPAGAWAIGGLEQPLVAGLLAWALVESAPLLEPEPVVACQALVPGLLFALLALTRADGLVLAAIACAGVALSQQLTWSGLRRALWLALWPTVAVLGQLAFRVLYYDALVPNTALVKVAFTLERLRGGGHYVWVAALASAPLLALSLLPLSASAGQRGPRLRLARLAWLVTLGWTTYVALIGGDIFPAHRHWLAALVPTSLATALGLCLLAERSPRAGWVGVALAGLALAGFGTLQYGDRQNRRALSERWEYNGEVVGRLLRRAFGAEQPLLAAAAVGSLCYHAELPCLDMLGLNDRHIARHRPPGFGTGFIGHELGDGAYALSRQPDLLIFCGPTGRASPCSRGEKEMVESPDFAHLYQLVNFRGTEPFETTAQVWVRRSGRVGIRPEAKGVGVPGHLLAGGRNALADLDAKGQMGLRLPVGTWGQIDLSLPPGRWQLRAEADDVAALEAAITTPDAPVAADDAGPHLARGDADGLSFSLEGATEAAGEASMRLRVRASRPVHVRRLGFERRP
ncbi:MAG: hypothetical protein MUF34_33800 [Polyangiaceae bacterium]|nr:hypothetical protein [Polyangiaceae bacterium]